MLSLVGEDQEVAMGQQYMGEVEREQGVYADSAINAYVDSVGQALAAVAERPDLPWSFRVVDDPVVNAFAARHIVEQMSRQQIAQLGLIASLIAVPDLMPFSQGISGALGVVFLKFSRDDESQSDQLGFRYTTKLGYDPQGAVDMFRTLERQGTGSTGGIPEWASTHPDPGNRVAAAQARIPNAGPSDTIDGLVWGEDPRQGYFLGQRFVHPELAFEFTVPDGWNKRNSQTAVLAGSPEKDAMIQLTAGSGTPEQAADAFLSSDAIQQTGLTRRTVNGLPAVLATFSTETRQGVIEGIAMFVEHGGLTYALMGYAPSSRVGRYSAAVERTLESFAPVSDEALLTVVPKRIEIVPVPEEMTAEEFIHRYPSTEDPDVVLDLNGLDAGQSISEGTLLKRITGSGGPEGS